MKDIFITSTLHFEWNFQFNAKICEALEERGVACYLPQRDTNQEGTSDEIFEQNISGIKNSEKILGVTINPSSNLGGEIGFAYGIGKGIIVLADRENQIPLMLEKMASKILKVGNIDEIESYIDDLINIVRE